MDEKIKNIVEADWIAPESRLKKLLDYLERSSNMDIEKAILSLVIKALELKEYKKGVHF